MLVIYRENGVWHMGEMDESEKKGHLDRLRVPAGLVERVALVVVAIGVCGLEREDGVVGGDRLLVLARVVQREAQVGAHSHLLLCGHARLEANGVVRCRV